MPSDLVASQHLFSTLVPRLLDRAILYAQDNHYLLSGGEWQRGAAQVAWNHAHGVGSLNSLHADRLAIDLLLRELDGTPIDGTLVPDRMALAAIYRPIGEFWKTLHPRCRWGGDFGYTRPDGSRVPRPDPYHFSVEFQDRR